MFSRSFLRLSSRQSVNRIPRQITTQIPSFILSRKDISTTSQQNASQGSGLTEKPSKSGGSFSKLLVGSVAAGAVFIAYRSGYLDQFTVQEQHSLPESSIRDAKTEDVNMQVLEPHNQETNTTNPHLENAEKNVETHSNIDNLRKGEAEAASGVIDRSDLTSKDEMIPVEEKNISSDVQKIDAGLTSEDTSLSDDQSTESGVISEGVVEMRNPEVESGTTLSSGVEDDVPSISAQYSAVLEEDEVESMPVQRLIAEERTEKDNNMEPSTSLIDAYNLKEKAEEIASTSFNEKKAHISKQSSKESQAADEEFHDAYVSKDGKLVLDFLEAIHAAERRQAELDAHVFAEEKKKLKDKYEKALKDAKVRELMFAEEAAILEKELNKERAKAAANLRSLQERAEEKLRMELEQKETEAVTKLKEVQELAKAELAAAIASEKASQIKKMAEANLHINALCMAFYARSEEARQSHSVHKLALGALALEDALSKGLPIQTELDALYTYLEGIDRDDFLGLVLSSLPEETRKHGTETLSQLNQEFDDLKGTLRHFSLIPPGGGGILAHSLAHIASWLKVKEVGQSGDGIESVINRVESLLAEGKLAEAAGSLEEGVRGSQAVEIAGDWVRRARNRATTEQALTLLQSYATSVGLA